MTNLTIENFEQITKDNKKVLIDFYADWCGPCQMIAPILKEIDEENSDICVCKVNVDRKNSKLLTFYIEMAFKRIFSENIPLLYISKRNAYEKYMFLGGFQVVFPMKNITSGFWKISYYAWKIYIPGTFLMKMRGESEKMSIEWENNEVFLLIIAFKG